MLNPSNHTLKEPQEKKYSPKRTSPHHLLNETKLGGARQLVEACSRGDLPLVKQLIEAGIAINKTYMSNSLRGNEHA